MEGWRGGGTPILATAGRLAVGAPVRPPHALEAAWKRRTRHCRLQTVDGGWENACRCVALLRPAYTPSRRRCLASGPRRGDKRSQTGGPAKVKFQTLLQTYKSVLSSK
jgi:hypothetical protein